MNHFTRFAPERTNANYMNPKRASAASVNFDTHDRSQIEISIDYRPSLSSEFHIDFFFFLPRNFGVNSNSYPRDQFYNDLINHLRFHTPVSSDVGQNELEALTQLLSPEATAQERDRLSPLAIQQVKLFASRSNTILKRLHETVSMGIGHHDLLASVQQLYFDVSVFRLTYVKPAVASSLRIPAEVRQTILNSDEFVSNRIIATFSDLLHQGRKIQDSTTVSSLLTEVLSKERSHRKILEDVFVNVGQNEREREYFFFRHSLLKKEVAQPLHIDKKSAKQERIYRNWVAGSGAALAGLWAQIADYQAHRFKGHKDFGLSMLGIGVLAILVYVFKDRIKDITKEYINDKMKLFLPDYRSKLEFNEVAKNGKKMKTSLGKLSEFMKFSTMTGVPEDISYVRRLKDRRDISTESQETVLQYHKSIKLDPNARILGQGKALCDIKDIHRFNFSYFLNHLDDSKKELSVYDEDEGPARISAPKVYHVNIVSHIHSGELSNYSHYRVILDKDGIVRMETVLPAFQLTNQELPL